MSSPAFAGLDFCTVTAVPTEQSTRPFQIARLQGYPDCLSYDAAVRVDGEHVDMPLPDAEQLAHSVVEAARLQKQGFPVDCGVFAALVAGASDTRSNDLPASFDEVSVQIRSEVSIRGLDGELSPLDFMPVMGIFAYMQEYKAGLRPVHFAVRLSGDDAREPRIISKFGDGNQIGITDVRTPRDVYAAPKIAMVDGLRFLVNGEVVIEYAA